MRYLMLLQSILGLAGFIAAQSSADSAADTSGYQVQKPPLDTPWTYKVGTNPWPEYPRPQRARSEWKNLNGVWKYSNASSLDALKNPPFNQTLDKPILVPSCIESGLSGVQQLNAKYSWFSTPFTVPANWTDNVLLNFGAVDYEATVFVNGRNVSFHRGGYFEFTVDITNYIKKTSNTLLVFVHDPTDSDPYVIPTGKQTLHPGHIFYRSCSGIWQSVWLESAPKDHVSDLNLSADMNGKVNVTVGTSGGSNSSGTATVEVYDRNSSSILKSQSCKVNSACSFSVSSPKLWSPTSPNLYDIKVTYGKDTIRSYTGFRSFGKGTVNGVVRPLLNGKAIFQMGTLDQGYWPDGLYTPPNREAMEYDLKTLKKLGFNMLRKHIKVETALFYQSCDQLGLILIQDMPALRPSQTRTNQATCETVDILPDANQQAEFERQFDVLIRQLRNYPSIGTWVVYNEGWGQISTPSDHPEFALTARIRQLDPTRLIDSTTGWYDHGAGDYSDNHHYANPQCGSPFYSIASSPYDPKRIGIQGEFGGTGHNVSIDHLWNVQQAINNINQTYEIDESLPAWNYRGHQLFTELISQTQQFACSGAVWTQTTDVEGEVNGLLTYDRRILRTNVDQWQKDIQALYDAMDKRSAQGAVNPTPFEGTGPDGQNWWGEQSNNWQPNLLVQVANGSSVHRGPSGPGENGPGGDSQG